MRDWAELNKERLVIVSVWALIGFVIGGLMSFVVAPDENSASITLALTGTIVANLVSIYVVFGGAAASVLGQSYRSGISFLLSREGFSSLAGYLFLGIMFVALPPFATGGTFSLPIASVSVLSLAIGMFLAGTTLKQAFRQAWDEAKPEDKDSKLEPYRRSGMIFVDIKNRVQGASARAIAAVAPRGGKIRFAWFYALVVLITPALLLGWMPLVLDLQTYTTLSSVLSYALFAIGAGLWAVLFSKRLR